MTLFDRGGVDSYWQMIMARRSDIEWQVFTNCGAETPFAESRAQTFWGIHWKQPRKTCQALRQYVLAEKPQALVLNGTFSEVLIVPLLPWLARRGVRVISVFHSSRIYPQPWKNAINRAVLSFLGWFHRQNFFVSRAVAKFWLCPGVVNTLPVAIKPRQLPALAPPRLRVAFIGRLSIEKGPDKFLQTLQILEDSWPQQAQLLAPQVYGDGPMAQSLRQQEVASPTMPITWHGWVADIRRALEDVDLLVISSRTEGFPMTVVECLGAGVPIVGFDVGGVKEGLGCAAKEVLCEPGDCQKLAEKIAAFCADYDTNYRAFFAALAGHADESFDLLWDHALGFNSVDVGLVQKVP